MSAEEPDRVWAPGPAGPTLQLGLTVIPLRRRPVVPPSLRAPSRLFTAAQPYSTELGQVTGLLLQLEEMSRFRFAISIWQEGSWYRRQQLCLSSIFSKVGFRLFGGGEISKVPQVESMLSEYRTWSSEGMSTDQVLPKNSYFRGPDEKAGNSVLDRLYSA